jgi:hypothetical protein
MGGELGAVAGVDEDPRRGVEARRLGRGPSARRCEQPGEDDQRAERCGGRPA